MTMTREEAKEYLKTLEPTFLKEARKKVKGKKTYICPNCENGSGKDGDGIVLNEKDKHYKCFKCDLYEDIIGLYKSYKGIEEYSELFNSLYEYYGIEIEDIKSENYISFYLGASKNIDKAYSYLEERGIFNKNVINHFNLGFIKNWKHPKASVNTPLTNRLIIPISDTTYTSINTGKDLTDKEKKYSKQKVGTGNWIFNSEVLLNAISPIWITEGELDALSIYEVGGEALALGSTSNQKSFIETLKSKKPKQPLVLALDNDDAGIKADEYIFNELKSMDILFYRLNDTYGACKDANELLQKNRELLRDKVNEAKSISGNEELLRAKVNETRLFSEINQKEEYLKTSTRYYLKDFKNGIKESVNTPCIPTGFDKLDNVLDGGFYEGLYILGAISSLGKTTLMMQIADQIANYGQDVIIFSLEMARNEIISKSISRLTILDIINNNGSNKDAMTSRGITTGSKYKFYSEAQKDLISRAITTYENYCDKIFIHEGIGDIGVKGIKETVEKHISITGKNPVVIIDYLQILAPSDIRATDKQNIDKSVLELKRLSRDFKIPVIAISSLNRQSYSQKINMTAFKESGAIEYSSDVLIGLQLKGVDENNFDVDEAKMKNPREVELKILKNRNGATGDIVDFNYYPKFNYFKEVY